MDERDANIALRRSGIYYRKWLMDYWRASHGRAPTRTQAPVSRAGDDAERGGGLL